MPIRPKSVAARVVKDLGMAPGGYEVSKLIAEAKGSSNLIGVTRLIHKSINAELGIEKRERNKTSATETEATAEDLDRIGDEVRHRIKKAQKGTK